MLTHPTLDQLNKLGLFGMAKAYSEAEISTEATALTHPEWLALLLDREMTYRHDKRLSARLRYARLRSARSVDWSGHFTSLCRNHHADRAIYSFQNRQDRGNGPDCQAGEEDLSKTRCRISSAVPFPHWPVGRRVAGCDALFQLGSLRQSAGGRRKGPGVRAGAG